MAAGHGRGFGPVDAATRSLAELQLGADVECWTGVATSPGGWRPADRALPDTRAVLLRAWAAREAREVASRRAGFQHLDAGVDRWATRRLLESGELAADAAGALRAVLAGNVVTEAVAAKWGRPAACPHCGAARDDFEHRFWACPCWEPARAAALVPEGLTRAAARARLPAQSSLTG
eukprot:2007057-Pyramimonas_sp.AAC.1